MIGSCQVVVRSYNKNIKGHHSLQLASQIRKDTLYFILDSHKWLRIKVMKKAKIGNRYNQVPHLTQDITWERDKAHENIKFRIVKRLPLSQQVTTGLNSQDSMTDTKHKL